VDLADEKPFSAFEEFEAAKVHVVAMAPAEGKPWPWWRLEGPPGSGPPRQARASASRELAAGAAMATVPRPPPPSAHHPPPETTAAVGAHGELAQTRSMAFWNAFWSGGIANPLEVLEQLILPAVHRRVDELEPCRKRKALRTGQPMCRRSLSEGNWDPQRAPYTSGCGWGRFNSWPPPRCSRLVERERRVSPSCAPWRDGSAFGSHMEDARFTIPNLPPSWPGGRSSLDLVPMADRDTKGGHLRVYIWGWASWPPRHNGQFRTPRHIIELTGGG